MTNKEIARVLSETSALIELTGGNTYRARTFSSAARTIDSLEEPAADRLASGTLIELSGIGRAMAAHVEELVQRGSFDQRDELLEAIPTGLLDVLRVKGLGPKRARQLWQELGITSLEELEQAAAAGRLSALDGFGKKTQANILENVRLQRRYSTRRRYAEALAAVEPVREMLQQVDGVERVELAGPLRRKLETVDHAALIAAGGRAEDVQAALSAWLSEITSRPEGEDLLFEGTLGDGLPLQVRLTSAERFGTAWWQTTGADAHCTAFEEAYGAPALHADEAAVYERAGLPFIAPELREGRGELEAAAAGELPTLIIEEDLHGVLHNHSTFSDGANTLREMAEAARAMGFSYFGICDHSRSLAIANGLSVERVRAQQQEIQALNEEFSRDGGPPFRVFSGIESDILADGSLDYPEDVLASFDLVVASVHSGMNMSEAEATERILRAVENPYTTILGHATGRLLLRREGYPLDHERVIAACAEHDVAIELNANPYRLDMDWRHLRTATEQGVLISINPDAHSTEELRYVRWGVAAARKGWLTSEQCLNAKPLPDFQAWLEAHQP